MTRITRGIRRLLALLAVLCIQSAHGDERPDVDTLESAFLVVVGTQVTYDRVRSDCARWFPELKQSFDRHFFVWKERSKEEISAAGRLRDQRDPDQLRGIEALFLGKAEKRAAVMSDETEESRFAYCQETATFASSEDGSIAAHTPNASRLLLEYLADNPLSVSEYRQREHEIGCIKQGLNSGSDYDELSDTCACMSRTLLGSMTDAESEEYIRVGSQQGQGALLALPQVVAVMPELRGCYSITDGGSETDASD